MKIQERGYVLLLVLVVMLIVTGLSALAIRQSLTDARLAFASGKVNALFVLADAPLSQLSQPSAREMIETDGGLLSQLLSHHKNSPNDDGRMVGFLCYDIKAGASNFHTDKMTLAPNTISCADGQVWLWFELSAADGAQDFAHVPLGADLAELTSDESLDMTAYRLKVYSLAVQNAPTPCATDPLAFKSCLENDGISHQLLVQEFDYAY